MLMLLFVHVPIVTLRQTVDLLEGCNLFLKMDQMQFTGSFKERGARNALAVYKRKHRGFNGVPSSAYLPPVAETNREMKSSNSRISSSCVPNTSDLRIFVHSSEKGL